MPPGAKHRPQRQDSRPKKRRKEGGVGTKTDRKAAAVIRGGTLDAAWQAYEKAVAEGIRLDPDSLNSLLVRLLGADAWTEHLRDPAPPPADSAPSRPPLHLDRAKAVLSNWSKVSAPADESKDNVWAIRARYHALSGDGPEALRMADQCCQAAKPHVRTYLPALLYFARQGDVDQALEVQQRMLQNVRSDLGVAEYTPLLQVCCSHGTHQQVVQLLEQMGNDLPELPQSLLQIAEDYFSGERAAQSGHGWELNWLDIDPQGSGSVEWAGDSLQMRALSPPDWTKFQVGLLEMARSKEQNGDAFQAFLDWLDHNPAQVFLDGANIGMYGQSGAGSKGMASFSWVQVERVLRKVEAAYRGKRVVVVTAGRRVQQASQGSQHIIQRLKNKKQLYCTPHGSNVEWYWLTGAVRAGEDGILVSNDEMRDNTFKLLQPRFFLRWRAHHRCKYTVIGRHDTTLEPPARFTTCVQQLRSGAWMLPLSSSRWLCARPSGAPP